MTRRIRTRADQVMGRPSASTHPLLKPFGQKMSSEIKPLPPIQTPSGKYSGDENFPVGSFLLPRDLRPCVAIFYAFARAIDDIADNPDLSPDEKLERLNGFEDALTGKTTGLPGYEKAYRLREALAEKEIETRHGSGLLAAFKLDATKLRYQDWDDLISYCEHSAAPVGRFMLDLNGESKATYPASDALCNALQIINHLQDCKKDYLELDRVYLPEPWFEEAGIPLRDLANESANDGVRAVLDRTLKGVEELLEVARPLPGNVHSTRLAMETAVIFYIAERLTRHLQRRDPLAERVVLTKMEYLFCGLQGVLSVLFRRR